MLRLLAFHRVGMSLALFAAVAFGSAWAAKADPITYVVSGTASGTIGGSTFTNVLVTVSLSGNTLNVVPVNGSGVLANAVANVGTAIVSIPGIGTATITDPTVIYSSVIAVQPQGGFPLLPYVAIGTLDNPPALDQFTGLGVSGSNALLGYDLRTSIGPIMGLGGVGRNPSFSIHTTLGDLSFTANIAPTTQGTFVATIAPVPEPATMLLLGTGLVGIAAKVRKRRKTV